ncbi:AT-rich interactive domain-containing protein [Actinidia chinensis var. chinensis]|uniref:AT-rich interactive domain-containing protein n=1 Tax=Actinidia chinensis var. chinensis TaxID=1590841 RepID=A0A2R6QMM4_ACTCC|nr:AT-rich interactive domain-containing protein [Actinidia chinensis var. chinensis]
MQVCRLIPSWICHIVACMGGCFGCCTKPPLIIAVDNPSKGLRIRGQTVKKASISEDFWSTGTCEMDNSAIQSQRSVSSMSTSNPPLDPHSSTSNPTEFVNHGLLLWNQTRQQWTGNKGSQNRTQVPEPKLSSSATYESLLKTNKPFPQPVPLPEMVDLLVDVWEQEGLYD